jgi:hypothetical protein
VSGSEWLDAQIQAQVDAHDRSVRIAAWEEACRAVCPFCTLDEPRIVGDLYWHTDVRQCQAQRIRCLIEREQRAQ